MTDSQFERMMIGLRLIWIRELGVEVAPCAVREWAAEAIKDAMP